MVNELFFSVQCYERFEQFFNRIEDFYDQGQPLHVTRPADSLMKSYSCSNAAGIEDEECDCNWMAS